MSTRAEKRNVLWSQMIHPSSPPVATLGVQRLLSFFLGPMDPVFDNTGDTTDRHKIIHSIGAVGRVVFDPCTHHPFTGMFREPCLGFVRAGSANHTTHTFVPGVAIKLIRDGMAPSANILALHSSSHQREKSFFAHDMATAIPPPLPGQWAQGILNGKFSTGTPYTTYTGQLDAASVGCDGRHVGHVAVPFSLRLEPTTRAKDSDKEWMRQLVDIAPSTTVYTLYGMDNPRELGGTEYRMGTLRLQGTFVPSPWADRHLFFRHERAADVLRIHPEWEPYVGPLHPSCPLSSPTGILHMVFSTLSDHAMRLSLVGRDKSLPWPARPIIEQTDPGSTPVRRRNPPRSTLFRQSSLSRVTSNLPCPGLRVLP